MNVSLIIAAAGAGKRFLGRKKRFVGAPGPSKLFYSLAGKPLLVHTLESFKGISQIREIIVAVPRTVLGGVSGSARLRNASRVPVRLVRGGATRAESVLNALRKTSPKNEWVLVHDGARPFPPRKEIMGMLRRGTARRAPRDGIILARPVVSTLKRAARSGRVLQTVDRSNLFEAETPQLVRRSVLLKAYRENPKAFEATDESSLVEAMGGRTEIYSHTGWNVKVTTPEDLRLAEAYLARHCETAGGGRSNLDTQRLLRRPFGPPRGGGKNIAVGFGWDTHRLVKGRKLYLGGVRIPFEKGALGHSDGDVLLHAVADAVLGAVGSGDIGEWFSDHSPRFKGIRSEKILKKVLEEAGRKGWIPAQIDSVIILERPRLGNRKREIKKKLARMTNLAEESVSVKAKTREGLGPEGEGRAVTCEALVLMGRGKSLS